MLARQHTDGRAASQKILDHLPCHIARECGDPLRDQSVVGRKHHQLRLLQPWRVTALNFPQVPRQMLERTE